MPDISLNDLNAGIANIGGTQNFHGNVTVYFGASARPVEVAPDPSQQIFISYGRGDDDPDHQDATKSFLRRLYVDLTTAGYSLWWDRENMPSRGLTFLQEIRDAITPSRRVILVVGPHAIGSDYVRAEWQYAQSRCIPVIPILRRGDYSLIPPEVGMFHAPDFRDDAHYDAALAELKRLLGEPDSPLGPLYGVPPLPPTYIERDVFADLRTQVLADTRQPIVVTAQQQTTTLHGLGGIGKTTLAAALSRACDVRRTFPDGIFWLEMGKKADPLARMADIAAAFGVPRSEFPNDLASARMVFASLMNRKRALLVLDDVWNYQHADAFRVADALCRLLITSRQGSVAQRLQVQAQPLASLSDQEGEHLLRASVPNAEAATLQAIVTLLSGHTLAVTLAAAWLQERSDAADLLRRLQKGRVFRDLKIAEADDDKNQNLELCLKLSYDELTPDLQRRFQATGIFALEGSFDAAAAAAVWGDDDQDDAADQLAALVRVGLLQASGGRYQRHGLLRAYARALLMDASELETASQRHFAHYQALHGDYDINHNKDLHPQIEANWPNITVALA